MSVIGFEGPLTYVVLRCHCGAQNVDGFGKPARPVHFPYGCPNDGKPEEQWPEWAARTEERPLLVIDT